MKEKYSKDGKVRFEEDTHTYWLGEKQLTSVTTYISQFKAPFDSDMLAGKYAKKHGRAKADVLQEWKEKGDHARTMGTFVHKIFEDYVLGLTPTLSDDYPKCKVAMDVIRDLFETGRLIPVETEYIAYNDQLAGQIDLIARNRKGDHFILDWKTNTEIKFDNRWQDMLGPFKHLPDCSYNHYSLQLNTYRNMCLEYDIKGCFIVHLGGVGYDIFKVDPDIS